MKKLKELKDRAGKAVTNAVSGQLCKVSTYLKKRNIQLLKESARKNKTIKYSAPRFKLLITRDSDGNILSFEVRQKSHFKTDTTIIDVATKDTSKMLRNVRYINLIECVQRIINE